MEFLSLLQIHYREQHLIDFYAEELCISTKHMSLCVKRITGFSAKQCINKYLITYAQQKLRSPKASISQGLQFIESDKAFEVLPSVMSHTNESLLPTYPSN